jgi:hypothetical protein
MSMQAVTKLSFSRRLETYTASKTVLFWACAAAMVATIVVGFAWGGWVTGGTSRTMASTAADNARGELGSAICVERFKAIPDDYKKRQFIESGGWATMPGQSSADRLAVQGCTAALGA